MARASAPSDRPHLAATVRTITGTRAVQRLRREGLIPGVVYGKSTTPISVAVNRLELVKFLRARRGGEHALVTLAVEQAGARREHPVIIHDVHHDPVVGGVTHIDFHAIVLTEQIRIKVPLVLTGEPIGVKQNAGVLERFLREIEVECLPTAIPAQVEHDVAPLKIGDTVHVRDLAVPAGARITSDPDAVVASVLVPKVDKPEEAAAEAAVTEPEVIREKKPDAEEGAAPGAEEKAPKAEKKEEK